MTTNDIVEYDDEVIEDGIIVLFSKTKKYQIVNVNGYEYLFIPEMYVDETNLPNRAVTFYYDGTFIGYSPIAKEDCDEYGFDDKFEVQPTDDWRTVVEYFEDVREKIPYGDTMLDEIRDCLQSANKTLDDIQWVSIFGIGMNKKIFLKAASCFSTSACWYDKILHSTIIRHKSGWLSGSSTDYDSVYFVNHDIPEEPTWSDENIVKSFQLVEKLF